jgi:hypothetical protein
MKNAGVVGKVILKLVLKEQTTWGLNELKWPRTGPVVGP